MYLCIKIHTQETEKGRYCMILLICGIYKIQTDRNRDQNGGCQRWGWRMEGGQNG